MNTFLHLISIMFSLLFVLATIVGCQTVPTRYDQMPEGHFEGRALVKDKEKGKSYIVNLDINARSDGKMRMDVTAAMGTPVAVLVVNEQQTQYILFRQKAYYEGRTQPKVLKPILGIPMDPSLMFNVLFDTPIENEPWSCIRDEKGYLKTCSNPHAGLEIEWSDRKGRRKTVKIDHKQAQLQLSFTSFQPKVVENGNLFQLEAPKTFKKYRIR